MVSIVPLISPSFSLFSKPLGTVPSAPTTIGNTLNIIGFFFRSLARSKYLFLFSLSFISLGDPLKWQNPLDDKFVCFFFFGGGLLINAKSGLRAEILLVSQNFKEFYASHSGLCIQHLAVWSNFNVLHSSQRITFTAEFCLVLHSFCASLLKSIIVWLTFLSLFLHKLHLIFCYVLSIFSLI